MRNILRFMKGSGKAVLAIALLLVIQAYCDLSLPSYTSDILNVGLQQNGIEHAAPETIRGSALEDLELFLPKEEAGWIESAYSEPDEEGICRLDRDVEEADRILMHMWLWQWQERCSQRRARS